MKYGIFSGGKRFRSTILINTGKILAQYSSTSNLKSVGLDSRGFRKIINTALEQMSINIEDYFTSSFKKEDGLFDLNKALIQIHSPEDEKKIANCRISFKI